MHVPFSKPDQQGLYDQHEYPCGHQKTVDMVHPLERLEAWEMNEVGPVKTKVNQAIQYKKTKGDLDVCSGRTVLIVHGW